MEDNKAKETSNRWYKKQERKKDQEVQNMLTLKSEEKKSSFKNWIVYVANCKLISKL